MSKEFKNMTIGELVAKDFRTASIFKDKGIDFCCGGQQSVDNVCKENGISSSELEKQIVELLSAPSNFSQNFNEWDLPFLIEYIINNHHKYVVNTLPELVFYTNKIADVHGENHPELIEIASLFSEINDELLQHLEKEENVLFPAIKRANSVTDPVARQIIHTEINRMKEEHDFAGTSMDKINKISKGYSIPEDACNTYRVAFQMLEQFENDLHTHIHLENNILFPKSLKL